MYTNVHTVTHVPFCPTFSMFTFKSTVTTACAACLPASTFQNSACNLCVFVSLLTNCTHQLAKHTHAHTHKHCVMSFRRILIFWRFSLQMLGKCAYFPCTVCPFVRSRYSCSSEFITAVLPKLRFPWEVSLQRCVSGSRRFDTKYRLHLQG